jgi:hypothetical protein
MLEGIKGMGSKEQVELILKANEGLLDRLVDQLLWNPSVPGDHIFTTTMEKAIKKEDYEPERRRISLKDPVTGVRGTLPVYQLNYVLFQGDLDPEKELHHFCGNKECVHPLHVDLEDGPRHREIHKETKAIVKRQLGSKTSDTDVPSKEIKKALTNPVTILTPGGMKRRDPDGERRVWLEGLSGNERWQELIKFLYDERAESLEVEGVQNSVSLA